jgi:hypothetical protein
MRGKILNYWVVNTSWCTRRVAEVGEKVESIFLDLPRDFESFFRSHSKLEVLKEKIDTKFRQHLNALQPLIHFAMEEGMRIYCYKDSLHSVSETSTSFELLTLVLKARLGKIDLDEWRKAISKDIEDSFAFAEYEANYIADNAANNCICLNLNGDIEGHLKELGFEVERIQLYRFNRPIDKIYSLIKEEKSSGVRRDRELSELVKGHVKFIDDVIERGYEEACKLWEV